MNYRLILIVINVNYLFLVIGINCQRKFMTIWSYIDMLPWGIRMRFLCQLIMVLSKNVWTMHNPNLIVIMVNPFFLVIIITCWRMFLVAFALLILCYFYGMTGDIFWSSTTFNLDQCPVHVLCFVSSLVGSSSYCRCLSEQPLGRGKFSSSNVSNLHPISQTIWLKLLFFSLVFFRIYLKIRLVDWKISRILSSQTLSFADGLAY